MMLAAPKVVAIDDDREHLEGLVNGLNQYGFSCLQVHFTGDMEDIDPCPHVRVIFTDLYLDAGLTFEPDRNFGIISGLIEDFVKPSGPYFIVLWTMHPDHADELHENLEKRLKNVRKPFAVLPLEKSDLLDEEGNIKSMEKLVKAIESVVKKQPQIAALLNWEERVLEATSDTVSSIFSMVGDGDQAQEVGRLLAQLAVAAAGKDRVEQDHFRAVNEALLPILADHIASLPSRDKDVETWKTALQTNIKEKFSPEEKAKLNSRVHIDLPEGIQGNDRGAVIALPDKLSDEFEQNFGIPQKDAAKKQFLCKNFVKNDDRFRWVLVQSQAACDYALKRPGTLPYYLGLELDEECKSKDTSPDALWISPPFEAKSTSFFLHINARFQVSLSPEDAKKEKPLYRLREQLLNDLIYRIHSYSARPGMISFRE